MIDYALHFAARIDLNKVLDHSNPRQELTRQLDEITDRIETLLERKYDKPLGIVYNDQDSFYEWGENFLELEDGGLARPGDAPHLIIKFSLNESQDPWEYASILLMLLAGTGHLSFRTSCHEKEHIIAVVSLFQDFSIQINSRKDLA